MMTSLHFSWGQLPDDRVKVVSADGRMLLVRWQKARLGHDAGSLASLKVDDLESALERLAFEVHEAQGGARVSLTLTRQTCSMC